jgi:hypothetical protein
MKDKISDFTETQFSDFIREIRAVNKSGSDQALGKLLSLFCKISEHPDGTDLIYYPEKGADNSNEGITETIKQWREANGLPGFKPRF